MCIYRTPRHSRWLQYQKRNGLGQIIASRCYERQREAYELCRSFPRKVWLALTWKEDCKQS